MDGINWVEDERVRSNRIQRAEHNLNYVLNNAATSFEERENALSELLSEMF